MRNPREAEKSWCFFRIVTPTGNPARMASITNCRRQIPYTTKMAGNKNNSTFYKRASVSEPLCHKVVMCNIIHLHDHCTSLPPASHFPETPKSDSWHASLSLWTYLPLWLQCSFRSTSTKGVPFFLYYQCHAVHGHKFNPCQRNISMQPLPPREVTPADSLLLDTAPWLHHIALKKA